jgi:hypothetical protein
MDHVSFIVQLLAVLAFQVVAYQLMPKPKQYRTPTADSDQ